MVCKTVLALDISSKSTGYAIYKNGNYVEYGAIKFVGKAHSKKLLFFEDELTRICKKHNPEAFFIEEVFVGKSPKTHKILSLYHGIAYKLCYQITKKEPYVITEGECRNILSEEFGVPLRQPGRKAKELTFEFIESHYGIDTLNFKEHNDITDALAIGLASSILIKEERENLFLGCVRNKKRK